MVTGLFATGAWRDNMTAELTAWDASGAVLATRTATTSLYRPTYIDLAGDSSFSHIFRFGIKGPGGNATSCGGGCQIAIDSFNVVNDP